MTVAEVQLWGKTIGAVSWNKQKNLAYFEYDPLFRRSGIELAPLTMPLSDTIYAFPTLPRETFHGLPGMLADSLPDKFGNALINAWLTRSGREPESFNPVERLCYIGKRGMGALEFSPAQGPSFSQSGNIELEALVNLASEILTKRSLLESSFSTGRREQALRDILRVGTSAGGARAKAIIAWNEQTNEVRSGQVAANQGFDYWLLKFDGVRGNRDKELADPRGYGVIEYAYHKMAQAAGIEMSECRLLVENGRQHFMTRRFDRSNEGKKIHMQTLCAIAHYDFNQAGAYSYEQALQVIRKLGLPMSSIEQQFRRMTFNILARNQDDHCKNIAFLMDQSGKWTLSPAYDITFSYNPSGVWTGRHQMTLNGKRNHFTVDDFIACADNSGMKRGIALEILNQVQQTLENWNEFAEIAGIPSQTSKEIGAHHRLHILDGTSQTRF